MNNSESFPDRLLHMQRALISRYAEKYFSFIAVCALLILLTAPMYAQMAGGTISGTVTDPSGAVVPNARIIIRNTATDVERNVVSNAQGFYTAPELAPGTYDVTVSAPGFSQLIRPGLLLTVGDELVVNTLLQLGSASERVEITGQAPSIELGSSTLSATVMGQTVRELPLNGRDWTQLATLEPGVKTIGTQNAVAQGSNARVNRGWGTQLTIGGNRPQQNNYRLDGISINDFTGGGPGSVLGGNAGVDAVQ
ncbi:MAG: carboxypeptidase regulatory-like domain-containing protein, partial [Acidobacteriia bacterium]|nr:carboxypeptidase regulatory-like domain-containing protein [Terriglobia bacterium]